MNIRHHFDDATLMAYAAGTLPAGMALLVACHLHWCPECSHRVKQAEALGGALLDRIEPKAMSSNALNELLARLDDDMATEVSSLVQPAILPKDVPAPLHHYIKGSLDDLPWKRLGYGVHHIDLNLGSKGTTRLLKIAPGVSVPHHTHSGNELTLILRGSYTDEVGRFSAGDVADLDGEIHHQPIVDTDEDCICLIATDSPLKFTGFMGRLVQPFIGM